jgi:hypothetical protein
MKIKYIYGLFQEVEVESDFIPLVGDGVSLMGCLGVPYDIQAAPMSVTSRTFSCQSNTVLISLQNKKLEL